MTEHIIKRSGEAIEIDTSTCVLCGICQATCPVHSIKVDKETSTWSIDRDSCILCGKCILVCPKDSLSFQDPHSSTSDEGNLDVFKVSHKLSVREVRELARKKKLKEDEANGKK